MADAHQQDAGADPQRTRSVDQRTLCTVRVVCAADPSHALTGLFVLWGPSGQHGGGSRTGRADAGTPERKILDLAERYAPVHGPFVVAFVDRCGYLQPVRADSNPWLEVERDGKPHTWKMVVVHRGAQAAVCVELTSTPVLGGPGMPRHRHLVPVILVALCFRVWAEEPPVDPAAPADRVRAVVLAVGDPKEVEQWRKRWDDAFVFYSRIYSMEPGWPQAATSLELGSPEVLPGQHAVVLGYCDTAEAERQVAFIQTFYPGARSMAVTARPTACPTLWKGVRLYRTHSVDSRGWRLLMNVYLTDSAQYPYSEGRKKPIDRNAGDMFVKVGLFDPEQVVRSYASLPPYSCVSDAVAFPSRCDLRTAVKDGKIVLELTWRKEPLPCSPYVYFRKIRDTYFIDGRQVGEALKTLGERSGSNCGE